MIDIATPYRHRELFTPKVAPFDSAGALLWPTLVGVFLRPVIESFPGMAYWFCNHGSDFQFCFAHEDCEPIENALDRQLEKYQTTEMKDRSQNLTVGSAFLGMRWLAPDKIGDEAMAARRSHLILNFLHSISALFLDELVQSGIHWKPETNEEKLQNPEGRGFESLHHLLCNITQVPTPVHEFELGGQGGLQSLFAMSHLAARSGLPLKLHRKFPVQF